MKKFDKMLVIPVAIIVVGVIAIIVLFSSNKNLEEEISAAKAVKAVSDKQMEIYGDIDSHYGRASNEFYSNKSIVVLRGKGATEVIRIYWEKNGEKNLTATRDTSALETTWGADDGKWTPYTITSKVDKCCRRILFKNEENTESFEVLVIVK